MNTRVDDQQFLEAISKANAEMVSKILEENTINLSEWEWREYNALQFACYCGNVNIAKILLDKGMDIEGQSKYRSCGRPLWIACANNHPALIRLLLERGATIHPSEKEVIDGISVINLASRKGFEDVVSVLLEYGADVNPENYGIYSFLDKFPLHQACRNGHASVVQLLIKKGANVNAKNRQVNDTPLHLACRRMSEMSDQMSGKDFGDEHAKVVELLVIAEADVNAKNKSGDTPLHAACRAYHVSAVRILLDKGKMIDITVANNIGETSAQLFKVPPGKADVSKNLCKRLNQLDSLYRGLSNELPDKMNTYEFLFLIKRYKENVIEEERITDAMRKYTFDLDRRDENGETLLHKACRAACPEVVHWLLKQNPVFAIARSVDKKEPSDVTPHSVQGEQCKKMVTETKNQVLGVYSLAVVNEDGQPKYPNAFFFYMPKELIHKILQYGIDDSITKSPDSVNTSEQRL